MKPSSTAAWVTLAAAACLAAAPAYTLTDHVEDDIESAMTESLEDRIEEQATGDVERQVEDTVSQQTEDSVSAQVESDVEAGVEDRVEASVGTQVESQVEASVEQQLGGNVEDAVEATVGLQVETQLETAVESDLADTVEAGVQTQVEASVGDRLEARIESGMEPALIDGVSLDAEATLSEGAEAGLAVELPLDAGATLTGGVSAGSGAASTDGNATTFADAVSDAGDRIEQGVWIVLVPNEHSQRIDDWGFTIQRQRDLPSMDMQLLRISAPEDRTLAQVALQLATDAPGAVVDHNHLYAPQRGDGDTDAHCSAEAVAPALTPPETAEQRTAPAPAIGLIDGEVERGHPALNGASIAGRDFVEHDHPRPTAHGTAVASILVGQDQARAGALPQARLHAASVLFEADSGIGATTESIVAALAWQLEQGVRVINVSLTGPANSSLEAALQRTGDAGAVVVAAVGNNGPAGTPLYPAAYDSVVGVSAVDACRRAWRNAARGPQVMFSALGVDVTVAHPDGGYRPDSGTSLAAPYVAAVIAGLAAHDDTSPAAVVELLKTTALDLGEPGPDPVYGHGLIRPQLPVAGTPAPGSEARVEHQRHQVL